MYGTLCTALHRICAGNKPMWTDAHMDLPTQSEPLNLCSYFLKTPSMFRCGSRTWWIVVVNLHSDLQANNKWIATREAWLILSWAFRDLRNSRIVMTLCYICVSFLHTYCILLWIR